MQKEKMTRNQAMFSIVLFNFGSSVVMGINTNVGQDSWIAILAATLLAMIFFLIYSRILQLFPEKNLFQIAELLFGKIGGKVVSVFFVWYAFHLAALILRNFSEFTQVAAMQETPQLPIMILMVLTAGYLARSGMGAIGKWSVLGALFVLFVVFFTFASSIFQMETGDLLPVMRSSTRQMADTTLQIFAFPYAETVLFLCVGDAFSRDDKPRKILMRALMITLLIFLLVFFRNLTVLGRSLMKITYFPSYVAARIIQVGNFLERIEGSISSNFLIAGILKIAVCLVAFSKGVASLIGRADGRPLVVPAAMLSLALCAILYSNTMEMFAFIRYYFYYALPFQVIIPVALWIVGEIYVKRAKAREQQQDGCSP